MLIKRSIAFEIEFLFKFVGRGTLCCCLFFFQVLSCMWRKLRTPHLSLWKVLYLPLYLVLLVMLYYPELHHLYLSGMTNPWILFLCFPKHLSWIRWRWQREKLSFNLVRHEMIYEIQCESITLLQKSYIAHWDQNTQPYHININKFTWLTSFVSQKYPQKKGRNFVSI